VGVAKSGPFHCTHCAESEQSQNPSSCLRSFLPASNDKTCKNLSTNSSRTRRVQARMIRNNLDAYRSSCAAVRTSRGNAGTKESISNVDVSTPSLVDGVMGLCPVIMPANIVVAHDFDFAANSVEAEWYVAVHPQRPAKDHKLGKTINFSTT
jgi:hypothetical protein